jgi:hypothetical protein
MSQGTWMVWWVIDVPFMTEISGNNSGQLLGAFACSAVPPFCCGATDDMLQDCGDPGRDGRQGWHIERGQLPSIVPAVCVNPALLDAVIGHDGKNQRRNCAGG